MKPSKNVFVGISLRNKTLTETQVGKIIAAACREFGAQQVVFLVADEIEFINLRIFGRASPQAFRREVARTKERIESIILSGSKNLGGPNLRIRTCHWENILNRQYWDCYVKLFSLFVHSAAFREDVELVATKYAVRRSAKVSSEEITFLSQYILSELPTLLQGIVYDAELYRGMIYPTRGGEDIDRIAEKLASRDYHPCAAFQRNCKVIKFIN